MSMESELFKLIEQDKENRAIAEQKLKEICSKSKKITYKNMINKLMEITENKLHINSYKFTSFIIWLVEELEYNMEINESAWDKTIEEIEQEDNWEEYKDTYNKFKNDDTFYFESVEEFRDEMLEWSYSHCLNSVFNDLKREYEHRKEKGLI
ncbi:hypothetical protein [Clostridium sporogenes]|uniref:hypothetical protein n=1 Tax=Clostridium sporogenes TaxID=1509 RepID=UPI0013D17B82|nr:hypothetical protein [Clostridium sporogenes]MCW6124308.1 hypothetical protein [Clostridium sporogenes]NFT27054.1 hypothetical protein [Clostridium sporogenes]